jgi:hypothetical protein
VNSIYRIGSGIKILLSQKLMSGSYLTRKLCFAPLFCCNASPLVFACYFEAYVIEALFVLVIAQSRIRGDQQHFVRRDELRVSEKRWEIGVHANVHIYLSNYI